MLGASVPGPEQPRAQCMRGQASLPVAPFSGLLMLDDHEAREAKVLAGPTRTSASNGARYNLWRFECYQITWSCTINSFGEKRLHNEDQRFWEHSLFDAPRLFLAARWDQSRNQVLGPRAVAPRAACRVPALAKGRPVHACGAFLTLQAKRRDTPCLLHPAR